MIVTYPVSMSCSENMSEEAVVYCWTAIVEAGRKHYLVTWIGRYPIKEYFCSFCYKSTFLIISTSCADIYLE